MLPDRRSDRRAAAHPTRCEAIIDALRGEAGHLTALPHATPVSAPGLQHGHNAYMISGGRPAPAPSPRSPVPIRAAAASARVAALPVCCSAAAPSAAAFAAFLNARTCASDSASTTSATDLNTPSSPYGPAASRQPCGRHAALLAEQGDEDPRLLRAEAGQRVQPPEEVLTAPARRPTCWRRRRRRTRPAPGTPPARDRPSSRGTGAPQGVRRRCATNSSGSRSAIARTSNRPPIRSAITAGPENAFSIVTCWSSTMPISSALASVASSASAAASPVRVKAARSCRPASHIRGARRGRPEWPARTPDRTPRRPGSPDRPIESQPAARRS